MEIAGNDELDKNIEVERKGLETPATRAGVIENLIAKGYVVDGSVYGDGVDVDIDEHTVRPALWVKL